MLMISKLFSKEIKPLENNFKGYFLGINELKYILSFKASLQKM